MQKLAFLAAPLPAGLAALPGMMRPAEQQLLYNLTLHHCSGRGAVVELGAFFGASTVALAAGVEARAAAQRVHTFDRFECRADSVFARLVRRYAELHRLESLLEERAGRLDFFPCFERVTRDYRDRISATRTDLAALAWQGDIELLHVDMPKTYAQLREAVRRTFAFLLPSAYVVLQDYLYHWSAELIAATVAMVRRGLLAPAALYESSLVLRAARAPDATDAAWLDQQMADPVAVVALIDEAAAKLKSAFGKSVVRLAGAQYRVARGMREEGEAMIDEVLAQVRGSAHAADAEARAAELRKSGFTLPE